MSKYPLVMVVDDNEMDLLLNEMVLKTADVADDVLKERSADSALTYISEHSDAHDGLPDLIFLDLNMPQKSGFNFLEDFSEFPSEVINKCKVIVISSSDDYSDIERINGFPFVFRYLVKPLEIDLVKDL